MSFFGGNDDGDRRGERSNDYDDRRGDRREEYGEGRGERRNDYDDRQGGYGNQEQGYNDRRNDRRDDYGDRRGDRREDYPSGGNSHGGSFPAGGYGRDDDDLSGAAQHASQHAGSFGDSSLFSSILGSLGQSKGRLAQEDVDEEDSVRQHQRMYGNNDDDNDADDRSLGSAAAMQALKMFSGGGSGNSQSGNSQSAFVGLAMGEASKLFDQKASQGKVSSGASKESAIQQAAEMALKYYLKSQGGSSSSGASGLMGLASKFL